MEKHDITIVLFVLFSVAQCQVDISGCTECDAMYLDWARNKTRSSYWQAHPSAVAAGDDICQWANDIYDNCYSRCAKDPVGNEISFTGTRNAKVLKKFTDGHCLDGVCRLADTLSCSFLPNRRSRCDPGTIDCLKAMLDECGKDRLCTSAERRAYGQAIINELQCFLSYPGNKIEDKGYTETEERGLQQCKDIIIVECLSSWSDDEYDLKYISQFSNETRDTFCGAEEQVMDCMYSVSNATVTYAGHMYTMPCKPELLNNAQVVEDVRKDVMYVYSTLCRDEIDPCSVNESDMTSSEYTHHEKDKNVADDGNTYDIHDGHDHSEHDHDHGKKFKDAHITDTHRNGEDNSSSVLATSYLLIVFILVTTAFTSI